jgi:hypothetical protein
MKVYVIDRTARQYTFEVGENGVRVITPKSDFYVTQEETNINKFYNLILNKESFIIYGQRGVIAFNADSICGIQINYED